MREFLGHKLASRGDYYWHKGKDTWPEAIESYALAHRLCPASRTIFEILASQILDESHRYPWSVVYRLASGLMGKPVNSNRSHPEQKGSS